MKILQNVFFLILINSILIINSSSTIQSSFIELDESNLINGQVQGKMQINGIFYNAVCDCNPVTPEKIELNTSGPKCDPSKLRIHSERNGIGATFEDIRNLIGNIEELTYVVVPETSFRCLDGRNSKGVLATPGGDAGEFILALSVYEDLLGGEKLLTQENVDNFLTQYLKTMKPNKFYMCTDDKSIEHIESELKTVGINIMNPRAQIIPQLIQALLKPDNIGDLHLKMMIRYPFQYAIRKEIIEMFLISFYKILWNKESDLSSKLELEVLVDDHQESAFVEVRSEDACQKAQLAPLIKTKDKVISVFVNHLDASSIRRAQLATFFADKINHHMDPVDPVKMHNRMNHHGYIVLEKTGSYSANGLPFYTINLA